MVRSDQESGVREIRTLCMTGRGLETGLRQSYTGTQLETADPAKGSLRGTAPVLDPTKVDNAGDPVMQKGRSRHPRAAFLQFSCRSLHSVTAASALLAADLFLQGRQ